MKQNKNLDFSFNNSEFQFTIMPFYKYSNPEKNARVTVTIYLKVQNGKIISL